MLTRCPHCTASFRVSKNQLQAAQGKVRCGACMEVFNASKHFLQDEPATGSSDPSIARPDHTGNHRQEDTNKHPDFADNKEKGDSVSLASFGEMDDLSDTFIGLRSDIPPVFSDETSTETAEAGGSAQPSKAKGWRKKIRLELEEPESESPTKNHPEAQRKNHRQPQKRAESFTRSFDSPLTSLRAEPMDALPSPMTNNSGEWLKKGVLMAAVAASIVVLGMLLAWLSFDKLARYDGLRPFYSSACQIIGCKLPSVYDISQIHSQNLVVRSHPLINNVLIIDAVIINQASVAQPFPDISLTLADNDNNVLTQRTFTPDEYIPSDVSNKETIPANEPVHVALKIPAPGKASVNYTIGFVQNEAYREVESSQPEK